MSLAATGIFLTKWTLKVPASPLLLVWKLRKPKKSLDGNLLMWSDLQGQTRTAKLKSAYNSLIIGLR